MSGVRSRAGLWAASISLSVLGLAFFFLAAAQGGQAPGNFEQEWSNLVAAAKQEGTIAIASGGAPSRQYRPVVDAFQKKFGIKAEISTGSATDTVNRVLAERKAGRHSMDVALISSRENNQRLVPSGSLTPFAPLLMHPEVLDKSGWHGGRHWYADKESKYTLIYHVSKEDQYESWYNTDKIKEAEIAEPKNSKGCLRPALEGKNRRSRNGRSIGDQADDRQLLRARPGAGVGANLLDRRGSDLLR